MGCFGPLRQGFVAMKSAIAQGNSTFRLATVTWVISIGS